MPQSPQQMVYPQPMNTGRGAGNPPPATTPPEWSSQSATGWSPRGARLDLASDAQGGATCRATAPRCPTQGMAPQVDDCTAVGHASESEELEPESLSCRTWEVEKDASPIL